MANLSRDCKIQLGWQYRTRLKSHGAVTNWCTGRGRPVNCMTVISTWRWSNMPFQRQRKLHIPLASYGKRLHRRAWLTIWDKVKIPRCSHKLMHRKRVTCELHDSYFRSTMIKHAVPKTAEVAYSIGQLWEEIAWVRRRVHISAWEFDGNIRPTIWTEVNEILLFTQACPIVTQCVFSQPSSNLHQRVQAS